MNTIEQPWGAAWSVESFRATLFLRDSLDDVNGLWYALQSEEPTASVKQKVPSGSVTTMERPQDGLNFVLRVENGFKIDWVVTNASQFEVPTDAIPLPPLEAVLPVFGQMCDTLAQAIATPARLAVGAVLLQTADGFGVPSLVSRDGCNTFG